MVKVLINFLEIRCRSVVRSLASGVNIPLNGQSEVCQYLWSSLWLRFAVGMFSHSVIPDAGSCSRLLRYVCLHGTKLVADGLNDPNAIEG